MEKELGSLKTQLEAGKVTHKKMQSDLQKELQYYFQENAKLTSLVEVNNSKGTTIHRNCLPCPLYNPQMLRKCFIT